MIRERNFLSVISVWGNYTGAKYRRIIAIIAVIIILPVLLSGCIKTSDEQKAKAKYLTKTYSSDFKAKAKEEFGSKAKVKSIRAEYSLHSSVWPGGWNVTTGLLNGKISIGKEEFNAKYIPDENTIISQRNYDLIIESLHDYFSYLDLEIVGSRIVDSSRGKWYLAEHIKTYEDMLLNNLHINTVILTTSDIEHLTRDNLNISTIRGSLAFVQINEQTDIENLLKSIFTSSTAIYFSEHQLPTIRAVGESGKTEEFNAFDYFHISRSVYFSDSSIPSFNYLEK